MKMIEKTKEQLKLTSPPGTSCDKDIAMAVLMRDPANFASLFNSLRFFKEKIRPEDLMERDSRLASLRFEDMERMKKKGQTLYRDVFKTWAEDIKCIWALKMLQRVIRHLPSKH